MMSTCALYKLWYAIATTPTEVKSIEQQKNELASLAIIELHLSETLFSQSAENSLKENNPSVIFWGVLQ